MSKVIPEAQTTAKCCCAHSGKTDVDLPQRACAHCGTMFTPKSSEQQYCSSGCARVAERIRAEGLGNFYELKDKPLPPVSGGVLEARDWEWLREVVAQVEAQIPKSQNGICSADFDVQGLSCVACVWLVEKIFSEVPGGLGIDVNPALGRVRVRWARGAWDAVQFALKMQEHGYLLGPAKRQEVAGGDRRLLLRLGVCGALAMNTMLFTIPFYLGLEADAPQAWIFRLCTVVFALGSFVVGGLYFIRRSWAAARVGLVHMDLPIALGITVALLGALVGWALGEERLMYFDFVAMFTFLMLLGRWTQEAAIQHNRNRLLAMAPQTEKVRLLRNGRELAVEPADLRTGDVFVTRPGQPLPVAATLESPAAVLSLEWINGESDFRNWKAGRRAPAGTVHISGGELRWRAEEGWETSLLARLTSAPAIQKTDKKTSRLLQWYMFVVMAIAVAGGCIWLGLSKDVVRAFQVALSVLVVSCPCAMGVALPLAGELAVAHLRRWGLYVRVADFWSRLRRVRYVVFDKTGTLTLPTRCLKNPEVLEELSSEARGVLRLLVRDSLHPVSRSLREALYQFPDTDVPEAQVEELSGLGVRAMVAGHLWALGKPGWRGGIGSDPGLTVGGYSLDAELTFDGKGLVAFEFQETMRDQARELISALKKRGLRVNILSGDRPEKVANVAHELGLSAEDAIGGLSPDDKQRWIQKHAADSAMMIGDGVNDSLAFDQAVVTGTAVADTSALQSKSDFYFLGTNLHGLMKLFPIAADRHHAVRLAFGFSVLYNLFVITISLMGVMSPLLAAILMPISSLITLGIVVGTMKEGQYSENLFINRHESLQRKVAGSKIIPAFSR